MKLFMNNIFIRLPLIIIPYKTSYIFPYESNELIMFRIIITGGAE